MDQEAGEPHSTTGITNEMQSRSSNGKCASRFELFILSEAGKPIYSYSNREDVVTLMPLCSALINYASETQKETLLSMKTSDNLVIKLHTRSPLIIIVIYEANSFIDPLALVERVEAQIISILTVKTLKSVFQDRPTFDLKRLLYGSEKLIDSIINLSMQTVQVLDSPSLVQAFLAVSLPLDLVSGETPAVSNAPIPTSSPTLPLRPHRVFVPIEIMQTSARETIHQILSSTISSNSKSMVFSLIFKTVISPETGDVDENELETENCKIQGSDIPEEDEKTDKTSEKTVLRFKLLTVCNHRVKHKLKIADIHIILALLEGSKAQLSSVESLWVPVCLPKFNQDAFLHSFISYVNDKKFCLVMLSVDRDEFTSCQTARNELEKKLDTLMDESSMKDKLSYQLSPLVHPILLELQEKLIGNSLNEDELDQVQQQTLIYNSKLEIYHARQLQFLWYQTNKQVLWWQRSTQKSPSKVLYYLTKKMLKSPIKTLWIKFSKDSVFLGWHVPAFQLYAQFDHTITTNEATEVIQRITSWIKKEEENFSIKDYR